MDPGEKEARRMIAAELFEQGELRDSQIGFGGGGAHGYNALEGTFLGGCLFTGRAAGRALAAAL
jgi:predicted oxidoreductase